jgi:two-component system sensor histidine kinase PilS (NtrC family)
MVGRDAADDLLLGMTFSPLRDEAARVTGVICAFQDLTQIRRMEEQIRRSDRLAAVGELAAGMAHEIRNPLASLSGSIKILTEELQLEGMGGELMQIVNDEVTRLDALITDFLSYASPREPQARRTDLAQLARDTVTLLRQSNGEPWRFEVVETGAGGAVAEVDPQLVRQVFWNLSRNAIEAMPGGGLLRIAIAAGPDAVTVTFADTGVGIAPAAQAKIFAPFFSTKERGTGLGLAIVFRIVEAHHGRVDFESAPGRGTTVRVSFPAGAAAARAAVALGGAA